MGLANTRAYRLGSNAVRSLVVAAALAMASLPARAGLSVDPGTLVLREDFPDPFLLATSSGYLAYATNNQAGARSRLNWDPCNRD